MKNCKIYILSFTAENSTEDSCYPDINEFVSKFYEDHAQCRDLYSQQRLLSFIIYLV